MAITSYSRYHKKWGDLYQEEGWSLNAISQEYSCAYSTVRNTLIRLGIKRRPRGLAEGTKKRGVQKKKREFLKFHLEWKRLYVEEGLDTGAIAKIFGCSRNIVARALSDQGVPIRCSRHYEEWSDLYEKQFYSLSKIANQYNCCVGTVRLILIQGGVKLRPARRFPDKNANDCLEEWQGLYAQGLSCQEIADRYDFSAMTIREVLVKSGVDTATPNIWKRKRRKMREKFAVR